MFLIINDVHFINNFDNINFNLNDEKEPELSTLH